MYRLQLESKVAKALDNLPATTRQRVLRALTNLRANPRPAGCTKLRGEPTSYRVRVGDYRIIYDVDDSKQLITVWLFGHRRDVYRDI